MTEQEIESLFSILNEKEIKMIKVSEVENQDELIEYGGIDLESLKNNNIDFLVKMSIVPKIEDDKVKFIFHDLVMKNEITIRALPPIDLIIALNSGYPSVMSPLLY